MLISEPIRDKRQVKKLSEYFLKNKKQRYYLRNYVLIVLGIHSALRISDLLRLRWKDVFDFSTNKFRTHIYIIEKKTKKEKYIAINKPTIQALAMLFQQRQAVWEKSSDSVNREEEPVFLSSCKKESRAISRMQAYRIISAAAKELELDGHISCHSLRKTFGYHAWKNGVAPALLMDIYNHTDFNVTRRYLGITQDDRDRLYNSLCLV